MAPGFLNFNFGKLFCDLVKFWLFQIRKCHIRLMPECPGKPDVGSWVARCAKVTPNHADPCSEDFKWVHGWCIWQNSDIYIFTASWTQQVETFFLQVVSLNWLGAPCDCKECSLECIIIRSRKCYTEFWNTSLLGKTPYLDSLWDILWQFQNHKVLSAGRRSTDSSLLTRSQGLLCQGSCTV